MSVILVEIICTTPNLLPIHFLKNENLIKILNTYLSLSLSLSLSLKFSYNKSYFMGQDTTCIIHLVFFFSLKEIGITVLVFSTIKDGD